MFFGKKLAQSKDFDKNVKRACETIERENRNEKPCKYCKNRNRKTGICNKYLIPVGSNEYEYCGNTEWQK